MKKMAGWFFYLCYELENHYVSQISMSNWVWVLAIALLVAAFFCRLSWWYALSLFLLSLLMQMGIKLVQKKGHLIFEPASLGESEDNRLPLQVGEQVTGWASGLFAVSGKEKYLVNEAAQYSFVRTREHIVMAHIEQRRFLLLTRSRQEEVGWWYVFFKPEHVCRVETGYISCGLKTRPGLALTYRPQERPKRAKTIYLAFADVPAARHVVADLDADRPARSFFSGS